MYVVRYTALMRQLWDQLVDESRNGTFIFKRSFMDYHADRFPDHSLILYDNHDKPIALFPATTSGTLVSSHLGLTYGGWIMGMSKPDVLQLIEAWSLMMEYYKKQGFATLLYKPVPHIYHRYPAEEDLYALFINKATLKSSLISSVIECPNALSFNAGAKRHVKNAEKKRLIVEESDALEFFWPILENRLASRYDAHPVHSLREIQLLKSRFPQEIKLWVVKDDGGEIVGGTLLFLCQQVVKAQYIASSEQGRQINAIDFLFDYIVKYYTRAGVKYIDLGPSCENEGYLLNVGLVSQKCGYGARGIVYNTYTLPLY